MANQSVFKKGIVLAGGAGTRLHPLTIATSKQLLPVFDKPMIYYPLSTLMLAGIREVLVISTPEHLPAFKRLLGDGSHLGMHIEFAEQARPNGIAESLIIGRDFVKDDNVAMVLGDNFFYGQGFQAMLNLASQHAHGATIFSYPVKNASRYGVIELNSTGQPVSLEEKPLEPRSSLAVSGLYFYDSRASHVAAELTPSSRGELEISDVNRWYLNRDELVVLQLSRGFAWMDMGTHESLMQAGQFVQSIEARQGLKIACLEEIAFRKGLISSAQLRGLAASMKNDYGCYLLDLVSEAQLPS